MGIVARQCWRMVPSPNGVAALFYLFGCVHNYNDTRRGALAAAPTQRADQASRQLAEHHGHRGIQIAALLMRKSWRNRVCGSSRQVPKNERSHRSALRTREYLTDREVEMLAETAETNRWGHRDATMIFVAYRHGLRASELVDLRWDQIDFDTATLAVRRAKKGTAGLLGAQEHPAHGALHRAVSRSVQGLLALIT